MEYATPVVERVLDRLCSYAFEEFFLAWGAQVEFTKLQKTLLTIKLVLLDAEKKQVKNPLITHWLQDLKDVCGDIDDVLDELKFGELQKEVWVNNNGIIIGKVRQCCSRWNPVIANFRLGHKVSEIRKRLLEIEKDKSEFALIEIGEVVGDRQVPDDRRETTSNVVASAVIGREGDKKHIIEHLLNKIEVSTENVSVISIIGLGGLGKTTLARLVYNDKTVEESFEARVWICVSHRFDIRTVVAGITQASDGPNCKDESLDCMEKKLQNCLRGKKFLLVLDDVWDTELVGLTREKWIALKSLLLVGAKGCKIIVTTRSSSVGLLMDSFYIHHLKVLSHRNCMALFIQSAFSRGEEDHHQDLIKEIGEGIVKKCGGVPLAVAALGGMLYRNRERHKWLSIRDDAMWRVGNDTVLSALKLSYDALPAPLKPCFAYFALFPKGYQFHHDELIVLWNAEGYLQPCKVGENIEQIGVGYMRQLIARSLIHYDTGHCSPNLKMHDLVHDVAVSLAQVEFSTVNYRPTRALEMVRHVSMFPADSLAQQDLSRLPHRAAITVGTVYHQYYASLSPLFQTGLHGEEAEVLEFEMPDFILRSKKLRTFLKFGCREVSQHFVKTCISRFKYMRVLKLTHSSLKQLPDSIGSLLHLRYLNVASNQLKELPNSICNLLSLEYLNFGLCSKLEQIPEEIGNLVNLQKLVMTTQQRDMPEGFRRLTALRVLVILECRSLRSLDEELQFMANLRHLSILFCPGFESLPPKMNMLTSLASMRIEWCERLDLMKTTEGPQHLRCFVITQSPLETLPLWLEDSAKTLETLSVQRCDDLIEFPDLHKFTSLNLLVIARCSKLVALQGLHCLTKLRELRISDCPAMSKFLKRQLKGERFARKAVNILDSDVKDNDDSDAEPKTPAAPETSGSKTLFAGNLSFRIEQNDVKEFFKNVGQVVDVRFSSDSEGQFRGYGHVEFATAEEAQKALKLNGSDLCGRPVRLHLAREKGAYTPHSGKEGNSYQEEEEKVSHSLLLDEDLIEEKWRSSPVQL